MSSGVAAVIGPNWSVYLRGRGGRGLATSAGAVVATSAGAVVAIAPILMVWTGIWAITGRRIGGGLAGFIGWGMLPVVAVMTNQPAAVGGGAAVLAALMVARRIQGSPGREVEARAALTRAVWDTDRVPQRLADLEPVEKVALP